MPICGEVITVISAFGGIQFEYAELSI